MAGLNTANQRLPEGYTAVRRVGEVPRVPDLAADNPEDFTAAKRPDLVALWDGNVTRGSALPTITRMLSVVHCYNVCHPQPNCAACVPAWVGDYYAQRSAWEDDKLKMTFKNRGHNSRAMRNLLEDEYEKACLADDLAKRSTGDVRPPSQSHLCMRGSHIQGPVVHEIQRG